MLRIRRIAPLYAFSLPFKLSEDSSTTDREKAESGFDRIKEVWRRKPGDERSNEYHFVTNTAGFAAIVGFLVGGTKKIKPIPERFKEENQATIFYNKVDAHKRLVSQILLEYYRGGFRLATKLGLFSLLFGSSLVSCAVYRKKEDILNFIAAGLFVGTIFKVWLGLRAMFVGGLVGAVYAGLVGGMVSLMWTMSGYTWKDMMEFHGTFGRQRQKKKESFCPPNKEMEELEKQIKTLQEERSNL